MTRLHSPWPLFSDDLDLATSWLRPQLQGEISVRVGHQAISLGLGDALLESLKKGSAQADPNALRQWHFRIARRNGEANPYLRLVPKPLFQDTLAAIAQSKALGTPLSVQLNGGIGDHLEALSLLLPWAKKQNCCLNLEMSAARQHQIEPLLLKSNQIQCNKTKTQDISSIPIMAFRAAVTGNAEPTNYRSWLPQYQTTQESRQNWLCCWRAEEPDKLSAHSRSIPWYRAQKFYRDLLLLQPKCRIVDITLWKKWEASILKSMGVSILDPRQGTLINLAKRCRESSVVTIDTALVHLCAAAGQSANLLLSAFPDERWNELHRPEHHYGQLIKLWRSTNFNSWSSVMTSLTTS